MLSKNRLWLLLGVLATTGTGCESCLDDYKLVDHAPDGGFGGSGGSTPDLCVSTEETTVVSFLSKPGIEGQGSDVCGDTFAEAGLEVLALSSSDGSCRARAHLALAAGTTIAAPLRVRVGTSGSAYVAGELAFGQIALPAKCTSGDAVVITPPAGATDAIFVAKLLQQGSSFCTQWAFRGSTADPGGPGTIKVRAIEVDDQDRAVVVGSLGGTHVTFEGANVPILASGGAFVAHYDGDALREVSTLHGTRPTDLVLGAAPRAGGWIATGDLKTDAVDCHACQGQSSVVDGAPACGQGGQGQGGQGGQGQGGAGGKGAGGKGQGGAGGKGGQGQGGHGQGGARPDVQNAFLWHVPSGGDFCPNLATYGSDRVGGDDAQVGVGLGFSPVPTSCTSYWTGLAGRDTWPIDAATKLPAASGQTLDGFLARLGGSAVGCGQTSTTWAARLVPSVAGAFATGRRVSAGRCAEGGTASAFVRGAAGGRVDVGACDDSGACAAKVQAPLASGADGQVLVLGFDGSGQLGWSSAFGPVHADDLATATPRSADDLATDQRDDAYVAFTTEGPLASENVQNFNCDLGPGTQGGTWVVALQRGGFGGKGLCKWARRFGP